MLRQGGGHRNVAKASFGQADYVPTTMLGREIVVAQPPSAVICRRQMILSREP